ncbi:4-hydroxybenzoate polyprenyltransferase [Methylobacterium sp. 174MFSha1.1]|uniref:4-hydroxybenzoate octaprenyltransferase n=1 Tax=Methylobacterium sp. 174MFSha1.1 TaxID=1502749 RepID=UPI0008E4A79C|nr:4-hydroxybenzoate octaprenyltransferase [Methylobacterium sp. 174MFSha1.1]SFU64662.1 4-hydroxybenzoate polyprenyltransferase [Methylobacterium sp. 174MFSha1.1]
MNSAPDRPVADAVTGHWVDRHAPEAFRPYLRLARIERPIGWWLLLLPCWWSAALAAVAAGQPGPSLWHLVLFLVGAVAMRGAGSTYNDIADRDLDARVERTRLRPLPSGRIRVRHALVFLVAQALVGLAVLLQFNTTAILVGIASLAPVAIYPFMKRVMPVPQLVLGLAFAWGALMGWVAQFGRLDAPAYWLYAGAIAWVIGYDTIYAVQDIEDDEIAGIKSSARFFGTRVRLAVAGCFLACVLFIGLALSGAGAGPIGLAGLALFAGHLAWQVGRLDPRDGAEALQLFRSNRDAGLILFCGLALDALWQGLM